MAQRVVRLLELIEIDEQQSHGATVSTRVGVGAGQQLAQHTPVRQTGQCVPHREPANLLLGVAALVDIEHRADMAEEGAVVRVTRRRFTLEPAPAAFRPTQAQLQAERAPVAGGGNEGLPSGAAILWMHAVEPALALAGGDRSTGQLAPAAIQIDTVAGHVGHPDDRRGVLGHVAEPGLAFREHSRRQLALGDVLEHRNCRGCVPIARGDGGGAHRHKAAAAVDMPKLDLLATHGLAA